MSILPKVIVILGPTTSGKSDLAVKIARKIGGEIISADSRQVYHGLDIGSGKVPLSPCLLKNIYIRCDRIKCIQNKNQQQNFCYKNIPHYLLNVVSPKRTFTVTQYQKLAKRALANIIKRGKIPIICGGTGLYIDTLIYDYQFPNVPPRPKLRKQLEKKSTEELFKQLQKLDPQRAKNIDRFNRRRLIRALEITITTKKPVPNLTTPKDSKIAHYQVLKIGIKKSPEELKRLIKKRLIKRLNGIIKEVRNLHYPFGSAQGHGLSWQRLDDLGLEYRYASRYLRGLISKKEMIESLEKEIYQYAKRQMTWFKRDPKIYWIDNYNEAIKLTREFLNF